MAEQREYRGTGHKRKVDLPSEITYMLIVILLAALLFNFFSSPLAIRNLREIFSQPSMLLSRLMEYIYWTNYWWSRFLVAVGSILILEVIIRSTAQQYRRPIKGKLIIGMVLIFFGSINIYGISRIWPFIIIGAGIAIIITAVRKSKKPGDDS